MFTTTFNPGPSQVSEETKDDIRTALSENIAAVSHRSPLFTELSRHAVLGLRAFFNTPDRYHVFFTSSATEAMELTIRNLVERYSFHFTHGNFSEYFRKISERLHKNALFDSVEWGSQNDYLRCSVPLESELITVTYNETSTGVCCTNEDILHLRRRYCDTLIAVDITSIAGVREFRIQDADVWFFSVQKCFGLPAGLGVMMVSERAFSRSCQLSERRMNTAGMFTFENMRRKMNEKYQTVCTPNVLGIYLLGRQLERWNFRGGLHALEMETEKKSRILYDFLREDGADRGFFPYVKDEKHASPSVICIKSAPDLIDKVRESCLEQGMLIGNGYGPLKKSTFRIANFPAVGEEELLALKEVMLR